MSKLYDYVFVKQETRLKHTVVAVCFRPVSLTGFFESFD